MMPENVQRVLYSYRQCKTSEEGQNWRYNIIADLVDIAEALPPKTYASLGRGVCPLCKRGPASAYYDGFTLPEGLRRHLEGYGNTQRCDVFSVLLSDINERLHAMFDEEDRIKEIEAKELIKKRMATEILYKLGPDSDPVLIDGLFCSRCRSHEELKYAEDRLDKLGFAMTASDNVKSYTRQYGDSIVYADPRQKGKIVFYVFLAERSGVKKKKTLRMSYQAYSIPDTWKHYIRDKYNARLVEARKGLGLPDEAPNQGKEGTVKKGR